MLDCELCNGSDAGVVFGDVGKCLEMRSRILSSSARRVRERI